MINIKRTNPEHFKEIELLKQEKRMVHDEYVKTFAEIDKIWKENVKWAVPMDKAKRTFDTSGRFGGNKIVKMDVEGPMPVLVKTPEYFKLKKKEDFLDNLSKGISDKLRILFRKYNKVY